MEKEGIRSVCILGAGNVATHLALAWRAAGTEVRCVCSPTRGHAAALAAKVGCGFTTSPAGLPKAGAYVLCVKDSALPALARQVAEETRPEPGTLLAHTAGSVGIEALPAGVCDTAVLYPLQTFSKARPVDLRRVPFFIEGNSPAALRKARSLAERISGDVHPLRSEERRKLHLAAVFANNFTNHCLALAGELMREAGLDEALLRPLLEETMEKAREMPAKEAQTGPAVRWDENVLRRQAAALAGRPEARAVYEAMSRSIRALRENG